MPIVMPLTEDDGFDNEPCGTPSTGLGRRPEGCVHPLGHKCGEEELGAQLPLQPGCPCTVPNSKPPMAVSGLLLPMTCPAPRISQLAGLSWAQEVCECESGKLVPAHGGLPHQHMRSPCFQGASEQPKGERYIPLQPDTKDRVTVPNGGDTKWTG